MHVMHAMQIKYFLYCFLVKFFCFIFTEEFLISDQESKQKPTPEVQLKDIEGNTCEKISESEENDNTNRLT